jgi:flagellar basal body-associated protein FliL
MARHMSELKQRELELRDILRAWLRAHDAP